MDTDIFRAEKDFTAYSTMDLQEYGLHRRKVRLLDHTRGNRHASLAHLRAADQRYLPNDYSACASLTSAVSFSEHGLQGLESSLIPFKSIDLPSTKSFQSSTCIASLVPRCGGRIDDDGCGRARFDIVKKKISRETTCFVLGYQTRILIRLKFGQID